MPCDAYRPDAPWYCNCTFGPYLGCDQYLLSAVDQVTAMKGLFGGSSDPNLVNQATSDFGNYLNAAGYDNTLKQLQGGNNWILVGLVGLVGVGLIVMLGDSGPRRYGR